MRKSKLLKLSMQGIVDMLKGDEIKFHAKATKDPIPTDAKVVRAVYNPKEGVMYVEVSSEFFPAVHEDHDVPYLNTEYQSIL